MNSLFRVSILLIGYFYSANADCRPGEYTLGSRCFRFISIPRTFDEAESYCRSIGYHLVSIHNEFENNFLQSTAQKEFELSDSYFRIGLNTSDDITWTWVDLTPYDYWKFSPGEPTCCDRCVAFIIADGKWTTYPCSAAENFVCAGNSGGSMTTGTPFTMPPPATSTPQRISTMPPPTTTPTTTTTTTTTKPTTTVPHACPRNWGFYPPTYDCYILKPFGQFNYTENLYCNGSIRTDGENQFVTAFAAGFFAGSDCSIGLNDPEMFMIGKAGYIDGNPMWQDGEPMDYSPQADGCPTLNIPSIGFTSIIAIIDPHEKVCWQAIEDTNFGSMPSNCQYFLCKKDGH